MSWIQPLCQRQDQAHAAVSLSCTSATSGKYQLATLLLTWVFHGLGPCRMVTWVPVPPHSESTQSCCWGCLSLISTTTHGHRLLLPLSWCISLKFYFPSLSYVVTWSLHFRNLHCKVFLFSPASHDSFYLKYFVNEGHSSNSPFLPEVPRNSTLSNFFNQISLLLFVKCLGHH